MSADALLDRDTLDSLRALRDEADAAREAAARARSRFNVALRAAAPYQVGDVVRIGLESRYHGEAQIAEVHGRFSRDDDDVYFTYYVRRRNKSGAWAKRTEYASEGRIEKLVGRSS